MNQNDHLKLIKLIKYTIYLEAQYIFTIKTSHLFIYLSKSQYEID